MVSPQIPAHFEGCRQPSGGGGAYSAAVPALPDTVAPENAGLPDVENGKNRCAVWLDTDDEVVSAAEEERQVMPIVLVRPACEIVDVEVIVVLCAPDRPISGIIPVWQQTILDWVLLAAPGRCVCNRVFNTSNGVTTGGLNE